MAQTTPGKSYTSLTVAGHNTFDVRVANSIGHPLQSVDINTIQVNIGLTCNLACRHCHVESSPTRTEQMDGPTLQAVLDAAMQCETQTIDITGGAPELNPHFRPFVIAARQQGLHVIVRTNLTVMLQDGYEGMPEFYAKQGIHLVASLPCYLQENVDRQRGIHTYDDSIDVIKKLNAVGYGTKDHLPLDLVYNPQGPNLPPDQMVLEVDYRNELDKRFGLKFTKLLTITNMAIGRFLHDLQRDGQAETYQQLLRDQFNPTTLDPLMCRHQIHVSHDGTIHDCDFNYALGLPVSTSDHHNIKNFNTDRLRNRPVVTGEHCFGCTAGCGSSCGGVLT